MESNPQYQKDQEDQTSTDTSKVETIIIKSNSVASDNAYYDAPGEGMPITKNITKDNEQLSPEIENGINATNCPVSVGVDDIVKSSVSKATSNNSLSNGDNNNAGMSEVSCLPNDTSTSSEKNDIVWRSNCTSTADENTDNHEKQTNPNKVHSHLSSIVEGEISANKHTSLPIKPVIVEKQGHTTGKRRQTESSATLTKKKEPSPAAKDSGITRIFSNERQSTRSGFGGTADTFTATLTPPETLKLQLQSGQKPHPLIVLPDDGKFWCDPPQSNVSNQKYFLSCFDMEKPWKEMYGDGANIVPNESEIAANAYVSSFSRVDIFHSLYDSLYRIFICRNYNHMKYYILFK